MAIFFKVVKCVHGNWRPGSVLFAVDIIDFHGHWEKLQPQVEIDEMVIETSQRFFQSFSSAFG